MRRTKGLKIGLMILATAIVLAASGWTQTTIKTVDGVVVVKNGKRPVPPAGAAVKPTLVPLWAIGGGDEPGRDFSSIEGIAVRGDGSFFVLDAKECSIKAFDAKAKFLRSFGKKGQGPGEFNGPISLTITPANELMVEDSANRRLSYFSLDGKPLRQQSTAQGTGMGLAGLMMDPQGRIAARSLSFEGGKIGFEIKVYDKDLKPGKTLAKVELASLGNLKMDPLTQMPAMNLAPDARGNVYVGSAKGYLIRAFDFDGRLRRTIEREYVPIRVKKEDQAEILKMLGKMPATGGFNLKDMIVIPEVFPAYATFIAHPDGRLLVRTSREMGKKEKEKAYDVFDPDGRYVSAFTSAADFILWQGDKLYGTEQNEDGFTILKCFRYTR
ncbi:MAG: 6-bladed beta-propeller [Candidatus Aminicenantes bacterium]|nr:6-bladed beta-propeller [Candidatus Aminicenantes bacterium]